MQLSGIIPVVAAAFTLMRLSRFNELTALLAAGVPLLRVAMPIIIASLLLNGLLLVDQELVIPRMIPKLTRDHDEVHKAGPNYFSIEFMQDSENGLLKAARYFPAAPSRPAYMEEIDVIQRAEVTRQRTTPEGKIVEESSLEPVCASAGKVGGVGRRQRAMEPARAGSGSPGCGRRIAIPHRRRWMFTRAGSHLRKCLSIAAATSPSCCQPSASTSCCAPKSYGRLNLWRVKHWRFTQPLMNVILLLLAIPCVLTREPGRLKAAASKTLFVTGLAMGCIFLSQQFAATPPASIPADRWTALMAWTPVFIFGPISVYLLDRVKT